MRGIKPGLAIIIAIGLLPGSTVAAAAQAETIDPLAPAWVSRKVDFAPSCEFTRSRMDFLLSAMEEHAIELDNEDTYALAAAARSRDEVLDLTEDELAAIAIPVLGIVSFLSMGS